MAFDVNVANGIGLTSSPQTQSRMGKSDLTQADFLRLMTEQLKNQDPLKPLSNAEFVSQMAQMSTAQGVGDLETAIDNMANSFNGDQALRGASLIGRSALVGVGAQFAAGDQLVVAGEEARHVSPAAASCARCPRSWRRCLRPAPPFRG